MTDNNNFSQKFIMDKVILDFDMFGALVENRINGNVKNRFIITEFYRTMTRVLQYYEDDRYQNMTKNIQ